MPTPIFTGRIDDKNLIVLDAPHDFALHKSKLRGKPVEVVVRARRSQRSLDQNAYLHGVVLPILCEHFGEDVTGMKVALLGERFGYRRCEFSGREIPIKPHTSELTTAEFSDFVEWIVRWSAMEHGVTVPLPNEAEI